MSAHNIQFHDKIRKFPYVFVFLSYRKNFLRTHKRFELAMVNEPSVFELLRFDCINTGVFYIILSQKVTTFRWK